MTSRLGARRRPLRRHKSIRQAISATKRLQVKFPDLAQHFQQSITSLQTAIVADVIVASEDRGCWTVRDFMEYCEVPRRVVDRILAELLAQGYVKKSKIFPDGKGRPPNRFRATELAKQLQPHG